MRHRSECALSVQNGHGAGCHRRISSIKSGPRPIVPVRGRFRGRMLIVLPMSATGGSHLGNLGSDRSHTVNSWALVLAKAYPFAIPEHSYFCSLFAIVAYIAIELALNWHCTGIIRHCRIAQYPIVLLLKRLVWASPSIPYLVFYFFYYFF